MPVRNATTSIVSVVLLLVRIEGDREEKSRARENEGGQNDCLHAVVEALRFRRLGSRRPPVQIRVQHLGRYGWLVRGQILCAEE
jgi:hypothetical protein